MNIQQNRKKLEEEKSRPQNLNRNANPQPQPKPIAKPMQMKDKENRPNSQNVQKVAKLVKKVQEKEVKLTSVEFEADEKYNKIYSDERLAIEDTYGLPSDDVFEIDVNDHFDSQSESAFECHNFDESIQTNLDLVPVNNGDTHNEDFGNLKKGIDNDAVIADISTMDGLSIYGDYLDNICKKCYEDDNEEDEELAKIDIFLTDVPMQDELISNHTRFDCTISRNNDDDNEEEKIQTTPTKYDKEGFPIMSEFRDDDYHFEFDHGLYDTPMIDEVSLVKRSSHKTDRCMSLFEDTPRPFSLDFFKQDKFNPRERSHSKFTEIDIYKGEWRNCLQFEKHSSALHNDVVMLPSQKEFDYFKKFDEVLLKPVPEYNGYFNTLLGRKDEVKYPKFSKLSNQLTDDDIELSDQKGTSDECKDMNTADFAENSGNLVTHTSF